MKIVHVIWGLGGGGAERFLARLVTSPSRRFEHVVISLTDDSVHGQVVKQQGVELIALGIKRGVPDPRVFVRLYRALVREKPDVVQTWMYHSDLAGFIAGKLAGAPVIAWNIRCTDMELQHHRRSTLVTRTLARFLSPMVDFAIVNSIAGKEFHEKLGFRPRRWEVIFNGFDTAAFRPDAEARTAVRRELGISEDTKVIAMAARFDPMKDHATFFRAASMLPQRDTHFLLAGLGMEPGNEALQRLIGDDVRGRVHLAGFRNDVQRLLAASDIFSLSSAYGEGFPNAIGEAMSCGLPSVATNVGDSAHVIGDTGRVVPPRDPAALAAAWSGLLSLDNDARRALGERARQRIQREFDLDAIVNRYESIYAAAGAASKPVVEASHAG